MQEPACRLARAHQALAIKPHAHARAALDAEIVTGERAVLFVAPPFHRDALGAFGMRHLMQHMAPAKPHRRTVRHFGDGVHRFRAGEKADGAGGDVAVLMQILSFSRKRGPSSWPRILAGACARASRRRDPGTGMIFFGGLPTKNAFHHGRP